MTETSIETRRLKLAARTLEEVRVQVSEMCADERAQLSADWLAQLESSTVDLWTLGFSILQRENEKIVGVCGFKGPPGADGIVEIAYGLFQDFQGQGYATEAAAALVEYAFCDDRVRAVRAHTLSQTNASARVLTKCGFEAIGEVHDPEDGWVWRWEKVNCPAVEQNGVKYLPALEIPGHQLSGSGTADHPMRIATRRAAGLDQRGWTSELRDEVEMFFDELAPEWHTRISPERAAIVADALERGLGAAERGMAVEVGSGIGAYSGLLAKRFAPVVAADLSMSMLKLAPPKPAHRVRADGARLPVRDGSASAVVLINAFLFPDEVARVLSSDGALVWVNSSGEQTPIHLSVDELVARLPGKWNGIASRAGEGLWCVLRRA